MLASLAQLLFHRNCPRKGTRCLQGLSWIVQTPEVWLLPHSPRPSHCLHGCQQAMEMPLGFLGSASGASGFPVS